MQHPMKPVRSATGLAPGLDGTYIALHQQNSQKDQL